MCTSVSKYHACSEDLWPYNASKFSIQPPISVVRAENRHRIFEAFPVKHIKTCLAAGRPVLFGLLVYDSFESQAVAETGIVPLPKSSENCLGGHALGCYGADDDSQAFLVQNCWGGGPEGWGMRGYCVIPYKYLLDSSLAQDFWCVTKFE